VTESTRMPYKSLESVDNTNVSLHKIKGIESRSTMRVANGGQNGCRVPHHLPPGLAWRPLSDIRYDGVIDIDDHSDEATGGGSLID
jgi:hypothetical protein